MKRVLSIIILFMVLFFGGQVLVTFFKPGHDTSYQYNVLDSTFDIKEHYQKQEGDRYLIEISLGNDIFNYSIPNVFNKKKEILKDIEMIQNDGMTCIYPIFDKEVTGYSIECSKNGILSSYETVKNEPLIQEFVQRLKESLTSPSWEDASSLETPSIQSNVVIPNILDTDRIVVWDYRGIEIHSRHGSNSVSFVGFDKYENKHGALVDKYYVFPVYDSNRIYDFSKIQVTDIVSFNSFEIEFPDVLSQNTYINGVVDGKVYYLDKDHVIQYEVNVRNKSVRVVGNQSLNAQFYNGSWETVNIYDLVSEEKKFGLDISNIEEVTRSDVKEVFENETSYFYYTNSGDFYRVLKQFPSREYFLFHIDNPSNVSLVEDTLYYVSSDTLYFYNEDFGQRKILRNNEFLYNRENRVAIYKNKENIEN